MRRGVEKAIITHTRYSILMNILVFVRFRFLSMICVEVVPLRSYSLDSVRVITGGSISVLPAIDQGHEHSKAVEYRAMTP